MTVVVVVAGVVGWAASARLTGTPDSLDYLVAARSWLAEGRPLDTAGRPFTQFAPGYPAALAALTWFGAELLTAARVVAAVATAVTAFAAGRWARRITGSSRAGVVAAVAAVSIWPVWTAAHAWSESLLIALAVSAGAVLSAGVARRSVPLVGAAGILVGCAAATRYAGLVFVLLALPLSVQWGGTLRQRWLAAGVFVLPVLVIGGAPVVHNLTVDRSQPLGPRAPADASTLDVLMQAVTGVVKLAAPPDAPALVGVVSFGVVAVVVALAARSLSAPQRSDLRRSAALPVGFAGLYFVATVAGAVGSRLDRLDDGRLLAPCGPLLAVAAVALVSPAVGALSERTSGVRPALRWTRLGLLAAAGAAAINVVVSNGLARRPQGLLSPAVVRSDVLQEAAATDAPLVVSNSPGVVAWALDRPVVTPPLRGAGRAADGWPAGTLMVWMDVGLADVADLDDLTRACDVDERADLAGGKLVVVNRCA